jgi:hypothetical protein
VDRFDAERRDDARSGMGLVNEYTPYAGTIFASIYALSSGMVFLLVTGITLVPSMHRLHTFRLEQGQDELGKWAWFRRTKLSAAGLSCVVRARS